MRDLPIQQKMPMMIMMFSGALKQFCMGKSYQFISLTIYNIIQCALPFIDALGAYILFKEKINRSTILAMIVAFGAINLLTFAAPSEPAKLPADSDLPL